MSAAMIILAATAAEAHICDNVWRQADKLIIKPETSNLVVKDKTIFRIFMQSNLDRDIGGKVRLVGRSDAFDVQVTPDQGHNISAGKQVEYEVTLILKPRVKAGQYPLDFDAVIGDRKLRSYTLSAANEGPQTAPAPASGETRGEIDAGLPELRMEMLEPPMREETALPVGTLVVQVSRHPGIWYYWYLVPIAAILAILLYRKIKYFR